MSNSRSGLFLDKIFQHQTCSFPQFDVVHFDRLMKLEYMQFSKFYLLSIILKYTLIIHSKPYFSMFCWCLFRGPRQSQLFDFLVFKCVIRVYDKTLERGRILKVAYARVSSIGKTWNGKFKS